MRIDALQSDPGKAEPPPHRRMPLRHFRKDGRNGNRSMAADACGIADRRKTPGCRFPKPAAKQAGAVRYSFCDRMPCSSISPSFRALQASSSSCAIATATPPTAGHPTGVSISAQLMWLDASMPASTPMSA